MPMRLSTLAERLKEYGIRIGPAGKHFAARRADDEGMYAIPAHNGLKTEIDNRYIKGLCKHFNLDYKTLIR
jgi:hypothetical protein